MQEIVQALKPSSPGEVQGAIHKLEYAQMCLSLALFIMSLIVGKNLRSSIKDAGTIFRFFKPLAFVGNFLFLPVGKFPGNFDTSSKLTTSFMISP